MALTSLDDFNSGGDFLVNTFIGGSIFVVPGANSQGVPVAGKVSARSIYNLRSVVEALSKHSDFVTQLKMQYLTTLRE